MSKGPLGKGFKRARDINSTYSLFDRIFQIIGWSVPGVAAGTLAGRALSQVDWFWTQYGMPGAVLAGIALGIVLIAIQLVAEFRLLGTSSNGGVAVAAEANDKAASVANLIPSAQAPPIARSAIVTAGSNQWLPQYRVEFSKTGRNAELYIRFHTYASGVGSGGGWTAPVTVKLRDIDRFIQGESLTVPIVYDVETREGRRWAFGCEPDLNDGFPRHMMGPNRYYRGAIMLIGSDEKVEWCFFVAQSKEMQDMPEVLGEHMWAHAYEWRGAEPVNSNPERLFR